MQAEHSRSGMQDTAADEPAAGEAVALGIKPLGWMRAVLQVALKLAYPIMILCAWRWDSPRYIGAALFALLWLQRWAGTGTFATSLRQLTATDWCVASLLSCASAAIVWSGSELLLHLYPSLVNLGLLVAFGSTLVRGPSMIEKFARMGNPKLGEHAVRYTRRVTQLWCVFFALNGAFSAYTALFWSRAAWSLYNGAIAYGLVGVLLAGEIVWRYLAVLPRAARSEAA
ncbi:hypothetical protein [Caballeronia mineralivorans]|jgi:uncharacterized membrane protein|uniref:COG4648 family protein n=2 Tax=Caballeronia mineralivorans TaxID=2010198 RepID=UPI002B138585|nr:Membrane protein [Caballeronia mineralivorans]MEA3099282.1 hypothetical protein [Caballeronia mineralivorans]